MTPIPEEQPDSTRPDAAALECLGQQVDRYTATIGRLADSSLKIKALAATAVAVLVTIAVEQEEASSLLVALVLLIGFATLDAYYLSLERGFRDASEDLVLSVARGNVNWVSMFNVERAAGSSGLRAVASAFASPATAVFYMVIGLLLVLGSLLV